MNSYPKVTIGIPVYNTEKYLAKCLDSIVNQTLAEVEIIIVNDCSTDDSEEIILDYASKDNRIVYIPHDVNKGPGGARNSVIQNAKADYIGFIDSDDWIESRMFEVMLNKAVDNTCDLVVCGVKKIFEDGRIPIDFVKYDREEILESGIFELYLASERIIPAVYNKLFKRNIFHDYKILFPNHIYHQDIAMMPRYMFHCNKAILLQEQFYCYTQRQGSTVFSISEKHIDSVCELHRIVKGFLTEANVFEKYKKEYYYNIFFPRVILYHFLRIIRHAANDEEMRYYLIMSINKIIKELEIEEVFSIITREDLEIFLTSHNINREKIRLQMDLNKLKGVSEKLAVALKEKESLKLAHAAVLKENEALKHARYVLDQENIAMKKTLSSIKLLVKALQKAAIRKTKRRLGLQKQE